MIGRGLQVRPSRLRVGLRTQAEGIRPDVVPSVLGSGAGMSPGSYEALIVERQFKVFTPLGERPIHHAVKLIPARRCAH